MHPEKKEVSPYSTETADGQLEVVVDDQAQKYAGVAVSLDPALERRLVRKADLYVCSFMCFVYAVQFMDKTSTTTAAIMGLRSDLKMTGSMYSWVGSSFYLGYMVFEIPVAMILQKFPLAKTTAVFIILWGLVLGCSAAANSYAGFITTRVLLGALEGAITPSFMFITSQWYKRNEQFSRVCVWFAWNGFGVIFGAAIAYGLIVHEKEYSIAAWRISFIILGCITVVCGTLFWFIIPNSPAEAWFLDDMERAAQVERIRCNKQGFGSHKIKWNQVKETFRDPRTYIHFAIVILTNIPNGGVTNFQTILYLGMGYDVKKSILMTMGSGAVEMVGCTVVGIASLYFFKNFRMVYANTCTLLLLMCFCLLSWYPSNSAKTAAIMLFAWLSPVGYIALISCISSNAAGSTKKFLSSATLMIGYCVGNLIGPQTFKASEEPDYSTAKIAMVACTAGSIVLYMSLTVLNTWENKRRDAKNEKLPETFVNSEFADLTDFENPEFRYAL